MDTETMKHTSGPWTIQSEGADGRMGAHVVAGEDLICRCEDWDGYSQAQDEANARLVAAAPAMFDTIYAMAERRRQWREDDDYSSIDYMDDIDRLDLDSVLAAAGDRAASATILAQQDRLSALTAALQLAKEHITRLANAQDNCWRDWPGAYEVDAALGIND
jgi:hypothetical protein